MALDERELSPKKANDWLAIYVVVDFYQSQQIFIHVPERFNFGKNKKMSSDRSCGLSCSGEYDSS